MKIKIQKKSVKIKKQRQKLMLNIEIMLKQFKLEKKVD